MAGKKIEITVPEGYDFVQEGNSCYFIEKKDNKNFASWEQKDKLVTGTIIIKFTTNTILKLFIISPIRFPISIKISKLLC
jgi:hypothetical protein